MSPTQRTRFFITLVAFIIIFGFVFFFAPPAQGATPISPASAEDTVVTPVMTPVQLTKQAVVVVMLKGDVIPEQMVPGEAYTTHGWALKTDLACGEAAVNYLVTSDGTTNMSVARIVLIEGAQNKPKVMKVMTHDHGANGTIDAKSDATAAAQMSDAQLHDIHFGVLDCIVNPPPAPKK